MGLFEETLKGIDSAQQDIERLTNVRDGRITALQQGLRNGRISSGDSIKDFAYAWNFGIETDLQKFIGTYVAFARSFTSKGQLFLIENDWEEPFVTTRYMEHAIPGRGLVPPTESSETRTTQLAGLLSGDLEFKVGEGKLLIPCKNFVYRRSRTRGFELKEGPLNIFPYVAEGISAPHSNDLDVYNLLLMQEGISMGSTLPRISKLRVHSGNEAVWQAMEVVKQGEASVFDSGYNQLNAFLLEGSG